MDRRKDIHGGHRERLRQRLMAEGADNFEPHELLEFLLYYAIPRQNVNQLAHELLNCFGNFRNVLNADVQELTRVKGMGSHAAAWLKLVGRCVDICGQTDPGGYLNLFNIAYVIRNIREMNPLPGSPCLMQYCLNRDGGLLYRRVLCASRKWGEPDILREGIRDVFSTGARFVILVLFPDHTSVETGQYDLERIEKYAHALNTADSVLVDFIVFNNGDYRSLRSENLIPVLQTDSRTKRICEEYISAFPADS